MKTSFLPIAWRQTLQLSPPRTPSPRRSRATASLEAWLSGDRQKGGVRHDDKPELSPGFDGSWHESSRALAHGLVVREWGVDDAVRLSVASR
jgi:hypothetical protein